MDFILKICHCCLILLLAPDVFPAILNNTAENSSPENDSSSGYNIRSHSKRIKFTAIYLFSIVWITLISLGVCFYSFLYYFYNDDNLCPKTKKFLFSKRRRKGLMYFSQINKRYQKSKNSFLSSKTLHEKHWDVNTNESNERRWTHSQHRHGKKITRGCCCGGNSRSPEITYDNNYIYQQNNDRAVLQHPYPPKDDTNLPYRYPSPPQTSNQAPSQSFSTSYPQQGLPSPSYMAYPQNEPQRPTLLRCRQHYSKEHPRAHHHCINHRYSPIFDQRHSKPLHFETNDNPPQSPQVPLYLPQSRPQCAIATLPKHPFPPPTPPSQPLPPPPPPQNPYQSYFPLPPPQQRPQLIFNNEPTHHNPLNKPKPSQDSYQSTPPYRNGTFVPGQSYGGYTKTNSDRQDISISSTSCCLAKRRSGVIHEKVTGYKVAGHLRVKGKHNQKTISIPSDSYFFTR